MFRSSAPRGGELPTALLAYGAALALFLLVPPFLGTTVGPPQAFTLQEATDIVAPLVIIPLAWLVFDGTGGLGRPGNVAFLVVAAAWVEAHGIHLAANAIGDAFEAGAPRDAFYATIAGDLDHWLDEVLSHWIWHGAWVGLSILIILAAMRSRGARDERVHAASVAAGVLQGLTFFFVTVEGSTTQLGIPWSLALLAWGLVVGTQGLARRQVVAFFLATAAVTLLGYLVWGAMNGWTLPEFTKALPDLFG